MGTRNADGCLLLMAMEEQLNDSSQLTDECWCQQCAFKVKSRDIEEKLRNY